jgi:hypothetical protein
VILSREDFSSLKIPSSKLQPQATKIFIGLKFQGHVHKYSLSLTRDKSPRLGITRYQSAFSYDAQFAVILCTEKFTEFLNLTEGDFSEDIYRYGCTLNELPPTQVLLLGGGLTRLLPLVQLLELGLGCWSGSIVIDFIQNERA